METRIPAHALADSTIPGSVSQVAWKSAAGLKFSMLILELLVDDLCEKRQIEKSSVSVLFLGECRKYFAIRSKSFLWINLSFINIEVQ